MPTHIPMAKPSSYQAAQSKADDDWFATYRKAQAARGGQSTINGVSADAALGRPVVAGPPVAPAGIVNNNQSYTNQTPYGTVSSMRPSVRTPNAEVVQADVFANAVEQIGANRAAEQSEQGADNRDRYRDFLRAAGIDPNTIGGATVIGPSTDRVMRAPTLAQQQLAVDQANSLNADEGRARIAGRRAYQRGNAGEWANSLAGIGQARDARGGGRSAETNADYWLKRILGAESARGMMFPSNGY